MSGYPSPRRPALKTVFVCKSLNLQVEAIETRRYAPGERITIKHQGRWLPMIIEEIVEEGGVRQVLLSVNRSPESVYLQRSLARHPEIAPAAGEPVVQTPRSAWIDALLNRIEGSRGPIVW